MNGITDIHIFVWRATTAIARHTMCTSVIPFIPRMKRKKETINSEMYRPDKASGDEVYQ